MNDANCMIARKAVNTQRRKGEGSGDWRERVVLLCVDAVVEVHQRAVSDACMVHTGMI